MKSIFALTSGKRNKMGTTRMTRTYKRLTGLGSLALAAALLSGLTAAGARASGGGKGSGKGGGAPQSADHTRRNKVSSDLRQSLRDSKDSRRGRSGDDGKASVILQLADKPSG